MTRSARPNHHDVPCRCKACKSTRVVVTGVMVNRSRGPVVPVRCEDCGAAWETASQKLRREVALEHLRKAG